MELGDGFGEEELRWCRRGESEDREEDKHGALKTRHTVQVVERCAPIRKAHLDSSRPITALWWHASFPYCTRPALQREQSHQAFLQVQQSADQPDFSISGHVTREAGANDSREPAHAAGGGGLAFCPASLWTPRLTRSGDN